jgi:DNA-binding winged helix-turn-helix (wHTH) protein/tetratricopeptide (TPR) repeat protein
MTPRGARLPLRFGPFVFDAREPRLFRSDSPVGLTHRALLLLHALLARAGELVTKEELVAGVWQQAVVSDAALAKRVQELRAALGDDPRAPSYIETVHGRGLRFIAEVQPVAGERSTLVGRGDALRRLAAELGAAEQSRRRLVLVSGEAGIGKTSLLQAFRADPGLSNALVGQGQCVPHGVGQPYLPVIAAVGELVADEGGDSVAQSLARHAPAWSALIPELGAPPRPAGAATQQRMLLELASALEWVAGARSVVLLLEDLHWADPSTIALLDFLSRRSTRARLLVVATFRDSAVGAESLPLRQLRATRLGREACVEIQLGRLGEPDVHSYLEARFDPQVARALAKPIFERTRGLPLFASWLVNDLVDRGELLRDGERWMLGCGAEAIGAQLPDSLARFFELQLSAMPAELVQLMETASVIGPAFSLATLARISGRDETRVESLAREIVGSSFLLTRAGPASEARFAIAHELLRDALYARIPARRRRELHAACAEALAGGDTDPAQLALHLRAAGALLPAAAQHAEAARRAVAGHSHAEAASHFGSAAGLLQQGNGPRELLVDALLGQGASLVATHGYAHPQVPEVFHRAERLAHGDPRRRFAALNGLHSHYEMRGELPHSRELEPAMREAAQASGDPAILARAHTQIGERLMYMGELAAARSELERACSLCDLEQADPLVYATWDSVAAGAYGNMAVLECELGYFDSALRRAERLVSDLTQRQQPYSVGLAHFFAALVRIARREYAETQPHGQALARLGEEHGFADFSVWAQTMAGYLEIEMGRIEPGIELLRAGLAELARSGVVIARSGVSFGLAQGLLLAGRTDEAMRTFEEAAALMLRTGEFVRRSQMHGLRARILAADLARNADAVRECLELSYQAARANGSLFWQVRIAAGGLSVARATGSGLREWRERTLAALEALPEGRDTLDQVEARALLGREVVN